MTGDIVARLRGLAFNTSMNYQFGGGLQSPPYAEAADEIERLRKVIEEAIALEEGDLVGVEFKKAKHEFISKARAALGNKKPAEAG